MEEVSNKINCQDLKFEFEKISPENDIGRVDLLSTDKVGEHLNVCPTCKDWVNNFFKKFVE